MNAAADNSNNPPAGNASQCVPCVLFVWLGIQLIELGIGAAGIELSARWPHPAHSLALHEMLTIQVAGASILFPWLMRSGRLSAIVIATSLPMTVLAGWLSESSTTSLAASGLMASLWMVSLAEGSCLLRTHYLQLIGVLAAGLISIGGAALWYLASEFNTPPPTFIAGPIVWCLREIDHPFTSVIPWIMVIGLAIVGTTARATAKPQAN